MPNEFAPSRMTDHVLNHPKGWFDGHALDYSAKISENVDFSINEGRVMHLNADGEFEMGISGSQMGIFALRGSASPSVTNPGTTAAGVRIQSPAFPNGTMTGLVATGGYELESSEYLDDAITGYNPNTLLTAVANNPDSTIGGCLTSDRAADGTGTGPVRQYQEAACGVVSQGTKTTEHGTSVVCFWSIYLPAVFA
jgi:hypothetical protein